MDESRCDEHTCTEMSREEEEVVRNWQSRKPTDDDRE